MLASILTGGRTSRLVARLVVQQRAAQQIAAGLQPGSRYPRLFTFTGVPVAPHTTQEIETAVYEELERIQREPPTDFLVVGTKRSSKAGYVAGCAGQLRNDPRNQERPLEPRILDCHDHLAGEELLVGDDIGDAVDRADRDLSATEHGDDLVRRSLPGPRRDHVVELVRASDSRRIVRQLVVFGIVAATDHAEEAPEQWRAACGDADQRAVPAPIRVRRSRVMGDAAGPFADLPEVPVFGEDALEHAEQRLRKGHVHDLPAA